MLISLLGERLTAETCCNDPWTTLQSLVDLLDGLQVSDVPLLDISHVHLNEVFNGQVIQIHLHDYFETGMLCTNSDPSYSRTQFYYILAWRSIMWYRDDHRWLNQSQDPVNKEIRSGIVDRVGLVQLQGSVKLHSRLQALDRAAHARLASTSGSQNSWPPLAGARQSNEGHCEWTQLRVLVVTHPTPGRSRTKG